MRKNIKNLILYIMKIFVPSSIILMFHHISDNPKVCLSTCLLSSNKFYEIIEDFDCYDNVYSVIKKPHKQKIAVTFDDGLEDVYEIAYPYLRNKNIPFTVFIITDKLDTPGYLTTEQLKKLSEDSLVTIGSHGMSHDVLKNMPLEQLRKELNGSKEILEQKIGKPIDLFAYSHGMFDENVLSLMRVYDYGFSTRALPLNGITNIKYQIPRYNLQKENYQSVIKEIKCFIRKKRNEN